MPNAEMLLPMMLPAQPLDVPRCVVVEVMNFRLRAAAHLAWLSGYLPPLHSVARDRSNAVPAPRLFGRYPVGVFWDSWPIFIGRIVAGS